jgi:outer membrane protein OmpA-like peptidoglycan-associated protein
VSDDKKIPGAPPPDDYSKTTPNIKVPAGQQQETPSWDKTNYNFPKQPASEEWGRTVANIKPIDTSGQDFDKTFYPGAQQTTQKPSTPEWGMTEARVDMANADFGSRSEDFGGQSEGYGKTTPYFTLPEAERAKYQNLPPTPTEQAAQDAQEQKKKGGVPGWVWALLAMFIMFFILLIGIGIVYIVFFQPVGFEVTVKGAPPGSEVRVDNSPKAVTNPDGSFLLRNLKAGEREVTIVHPNFTCEPRRVVGHDGETVEPIIARCQPIAAKATDDCANFQPGEFDKAERCYYKALGDLPDPFTPDDLIKALNLLIINFDTGKSDVPPARLAALQKGAEYIKKLQQTQPTVVLEVGGHTDNTGSEKTNQPLSESRADSVKKALVLYGVNPAGLQTRGYGSTQPKFDNSTDQGKFLNRRIQYSIVKK